MDRSPPGRVTTRPYNAGAIRTFVAVVTLSIAPGCVGHITDAQNDSGTIRNDVVDAGVDRVTPPMDVPTAIDVPMGVDTPQPPVDTPTTPTDTGSPDTGIACSPSCPANAHCHGGTCQCDPYFVSMGSSCVGIVPGDPTTHSDVDVCAQWAEGHRTTASEGYTAGATMCDPGSMSRDAIDDSLRRMNAYRWLVGLTPVTDSDSLNANDQQCSLMEHLKGWPGASNPDPHHPTSTWPCYTAEGAGAAGSSNISWGTRSAAEAVDNWMEDSGNDTTLGHRRWILHPPLGPIGIGFYGDASCMGVFGSSGGGTSGDWYAYPPPGAVPDGITHAAWSWHTTRYNVGSATVTITRMSDGMNLGVRMLSLLQGFGDTTVGWFPSGWSPTAGETYLVSIGGLTGGSSATVDYSVRVVACP